MFSTNAGEALPVRTPENSWTTTSSVLIIFSSASSRISSTGIGRLAYQTHAQLYSAKRVASRERRALLPVVPTHSKIRATQETEMTGQLSAAEERFERIRQRAGLFLAPAAALVL